MWYSLNTHQSDAGPRRVFFVRNPTWNKNLVANCTVSIDISSCSGPYKWDIAVKLILCHSHLITHSHTHHMLLTQIALVDPGVTCSRRKQSFFIKLKCSKLNWSWLCENAMLLRRTDIQIGFGIELSLKRQKQYNEDCPQS